MNPTTETARALRENGIVRLPGFLDPDALARLKACFDWSVEHPGPRAVGTPTGPRFTAADTLNPEAMSTYLDTVRSLGLAERLRELWSSEHVWYLGEEFFWKRGRAAGTTWHQDTSYFPWNGDHYANAWICYDSLPASHSLEVVRGSHRGTRYDGSLFRRRDPTLPLWGDLADLPRLPDIQRERVEQPERWDIVSFDVEPGDVILLHGGLLHGGAPVDEDCPERRTTVLRFFGDDLVWTALPEDSAAVTDEMRTLAEFERRGVPGEPMRHPSAVQLL